MIGYTTWHQLLVYGCDNCVISLFVLSSDILQFSYLSCYLVSYICSCSCYYLCTLFTCTSFSLYTHTHQVAFWRPWICTSRYWTIVSIVQVFDETVYFARSWSLSPFYPGILAFLYSYHYPWFMYFTLSFFHTISCVVITCIIAVITDYISSYL